MRKTFSQTLDSPLFIFLAFAALVLFIVFVHTTHFSGRNYRQDEAWVVHHALVLFEEEGFVQHAIIGPVTRIQPENFIQDIWVFFMGHHENIVRFLSTLYTMLGLAVLFRIGKDLFDARVGLLAVFLLGTLGFFEFHVHEARPYAALVFGTVVFMLAFLRYIKYPRWVYILLMVAAGVVTLYEHSFMLYVIAAHALAFVIFVRFRLRMYIEMVLVLLVIGLLYLPRYWIVTTAANYGGGIDYALDTSWESLQLLFDQMHLRPDAIFWLLFISGLLLPVARLFPNLASARLRFRPEWRKWYLVLIPLTILIVSFTINSSVANVTPRNLIIILPALALFTAFALRNLPWQAVLAVMILLTIPFVTEFRPLVSNRGEREMAEYLASEMDAETDKLIVAGNQAWEHAPILYYLDERTSLDLAEENRLHLLGAPDIHLATLPTPPENVVWDTGSDSRSQFDAFIGDVERLWWVEANPVPFEDVYLRLIDREYIANRQIAFDDESYSVPLTVTEYVRIPENLETLANYEDQVELEAWDLLNDVESQACEILQVDTWWFTPGVPAENYNMTLVLANQEGNGVAQSDGAPNDVLMKLWQPEQLMLDERELLIPCDVPSGSYDLLVGIYDPVSLENLSIVASDGENASGLYYMTTIQVENE